MSLIIDVVVCMWLCL